MRLEIGNKVAVIDDIIEGIVVKIKNNIITIKDNEGMLFTFLKDELVRVEKYQSNLLNNYNLDNKFLNEKKTHEKNKKKLVFKKQKNKVIMEIDLHIEKLVKFTKNMQNIDILNYQLEIAKKKIEFCIDKKIPKIVFIHGVGEGVLKTELELLLNNYAVSYQEASFQRYGFGATEVYVYQNV